MHKVKRIFSWRYHTFQMLRINVDGFICVGTNFHGLNKNDTKCVVIVFSLIINTENYHFVGTMYWNSWIGPFTKITKIGTPPNLSHPQYTDPH